MGIRLINVVQDVSCLRQWRGYNVVNVSCYSQCRGHNLITMWVSNC